MPTAPDSKVRKGSFRPIQAQSLSRDNLTFGRDAVSADAAPSTADQVKLAKSIAELPVGALVRLDPEFKIATPQAAKLRPLPAGTITAIEKQGSFMYVSKAATEPKVVKQGQRKPVYGLITKDLVVLGTETPPQNLTRDPARRPRKPAGARTGGESE